MKKLLAAGGLAIFAANAVAAEGWYIAPKLGYTVTDSDRNVDDAFNGGLAVGWLLNRNLGFELNALAGTHDAEVGGGHLNLTALSADIVGRFATDSSVSPYLTAGVGAIRDDFSPGGDRDDFLVQAGAGLLIRVWQSNDGSRSFKLRPEVKVRWDDVGGAGHMRDVLASLGFQWEFGAPAHMAPAPAPAPVAAPAPAPAPVPAAPPPRVDSDGDGVFDDEDRCPATPRGTAVDANGCPLKGSITLAGVNFENNSARLLPESLAVLDTVAADLKRHARLKVEIQGHTDSVGSDAYNLKLSQSRADSVRNYLLKQGVGAAQLAAKGYGEANPVAGNDTPAGRAENRRVAMEVLDNPGDVEVKQAN